MNCGSSHPKTSTSAAITSAGLSKRLHGGRGTGAGDLSFIGALEPILNQWSVFARERSRASIGLQAQCLHSTTITFGRHPVLDRVYVDVRVAARQLEVFLNLDVEAALPQNLAGSRLEVSPASRRGFDQPFTAPLLLWEIELARRHETIVLSDVGGKNLLQSFYQPDLISGVLTYCHSPLECGFALRLAPLGAAC